MTSGARSPSRDGPAEARGRHRLIIGPGEAGQRLDRVLAIRFPDHSRAALQRLIRDGCVTLPGSSRGPARPGRIVAEGEIVEVVIPAPEPSPLRPEPIPLDVLYEDRHLLVLCKPPGLVVHPGAGVHAGTLVHALLHHCADLSGIGGVERPGIVHRLDKETSGVMVVAKDDPTHRDITRQFQQRTVAKVYVALVWGVPARPEGVVEVPIGRDARRRVTISARTDRPRDASTAWSLIERFRGVSWLEARPRTGRTHQIRVHLSIIGHPIVGDRTYGGSRWDRAPEAADRDALRSFGRLALHARRLSFVHPATGRRVDFEAALPADLEALLAALRGRR